MQVCSVVKAPGCDRCLHAEACSSPLHCSALRFRVSALAESQAFSFKPVDMASADPMIAAEARGFRASVQAALELNDASGLQFHAQQGRLLRPQQHIQDQTFQPDNHGPVSHAVMHRSNRVLHMLLFGPQKLSPNERDDLGRTPLMLHLQSTGPSPTLAGKDAEIIRLLLDAKANCVAMDCVSANAL